jgi:hypothetical protein
MLWQSINDGGVMQLSQWGVSQSQKRHKRISLIDPNELVEIDLEFETIKK